MHTSSITNRARSPLLCRDSKIEPRAALATSCSGVMYSSFTVGRSFCSSCKDTHKLSFLVTFTSQNWRCMISARQRLTLKTARFSLSVCCELRYVAGTPPLAVVTRALTYANFTKFSKAHIGYNLCSACRSHLVTHLVLHERQEWRDDHCESTRDDCRKLVTETLSWT